MFHMARILTRRMATRHAYCVRQCLFPIMAVYRKWESVENRWLSTGWMEEEERQLACAIRDLHLSAQFLLIMVTVLTRLDQERARSSHVVEQGKG
jgi:hypothetical protein